ncbi:MAG: alpha/beta hydrolase [Ilumatobacteraceae bacterium]
MAVTTERIAFPVVFPIVQAFRDTYGGAGDVVALECYLVRPVDIPSDTVLVMSHPIGGGGYLPIVNSLARAGHHIAYVNTRYRGIDVALIMESVLIDLGAAIRHIKQRMGYAKVVLVGWSGGGAASLYFQEQAEHLTIADTPAGDPVDLEALRALEPADGVILMAAHTSRHQVLTDALDPSIIDEVDLSRRNPAMDLYDPANPQQPPYDRSFLAEFRAAQVARNRKITAWVLETLESLRATGRPADERGFVVHGTCADPRWLDATIDRNERRPGTCWLGDPRTVNMGPVGLARFCTLRGWLSQWSIDHARADGRRAASNISVPVLVVSNGADDICVPQHSQDVFDAVRHLDKELVTIAGATHYYTGPDQAQKLAQATDICSDWLRRHALTST